MQNWVRSVFPKQHSMRAIVDSLRDEVNLDGIRIMSLFIGMTATLGMKGLYEKKGKISPTLLLQLEDIASMLGHYYFIFHCDKIIFRLY